MPQVDVVITTYNSERFVQATIRSVQQQTFTDWNLWVVDDASSDATVDMVSDLAQADRRIRCVPASRHAGCPAPGRNLGLSRVTSPFVAFLDADDRWRPRKLARQIAVLRAHPDAALAYSLALAPHPWRVLASRHRAFLFPHPQRAAREGRDLHRGNSIPFSSVLARTAVITQAGGFDESLTAVEDYDLWLRLGPNASFAFLPEILVLYRLHRTNISSENREENSLGIVQKRHGLPFRPTIGATSAPRKIFHLMRSLAWLVRHARS